MTFQAAERQKRIPAKTILSAAEGLKIKVFTFLVPITIDFIEVESTGK
jgi:hypothetical protein